jgi:hypothetical protein
MNLSYDDSLRLAKYYPENIWQVTSDLEHFKEKRKSLMALKTSIPRRLREGEDNTLTSQQKVLGSPDIVDNIRSFLGGKKRKIRK